jgi:transcription elongation factor GreB
MVNQTDDDSDELPLPKGTKNYITPGGFKRLQDDLKRLLYTERPEIVAKVSWAASNGDRSENADYIYGKRRLREIDRKIGFITKRLEFSEVIDPTTQKSDLVLFGATVTLENEDGAPLTYRIVGIDETNPGLGHISWVSPIGKALLRHKVGDVVLVRTPKGEQEFEILEIRYENIPTP